MFQPPSTLSSIRRALVAVVALAILVVHPALAQAVTFPSSAAGGRLSHKFGEEILPSRDAAVALAKSHGMIMIDQVWRLGYEGTFDGTVADTYYDEMKAANPGLLVFRYYNAVYDQRTDLPESWYMHNAAGHRLYNPSYRTYLMNPRSTQAWTGYPPYAKSPSTSNGWSEYLANFYRADAARAPGVFAGPWFDDIGGRPHMVDAVTGVASDPVDTDGTGFTEAEWQGLTAGMVGKVQSIVGGARAGNALLSAYCYYTGCGGDRPLSWFFTANQLDEAMAEGYLRNWWADPNLFYDVTNWLQSVQFLIDTDALGKYVQVTTALPTSATVAQVDQWRKYAYATYLLGNNGRAYFEFVPYGNPRGESSNPLYALDIGTPTQTASQASGYANGGWYERSFTKGKVVVNPTVAAVTVSLGSSYLLPNGTTVTSLTLGPNSGEILRLAGNAPPPPPPPPPSDSGNLLPNGSFEGSTSGLGTWSSTLSLVGGTVGAQALRVTRANYDTYGIIASPAPATALTAGAVYEGGGWLRSATVGRRVCLVVREQKTDGSLVYSSSCLTSTGSWQAFPTVRHTVAATGSLLDFYVYQSGAVAGDSFELDGLTLTRR